MGTPRRSLNWMKFIAGKWRRSHDHSSTKILAIVSSYLKTLWSCRVLQFSCWSQSMVACLALVKCKLCALHLLSFLPSFVFAWLLFQYDARSCEKGFYSRWRTIAPQTCIVKKSVKQNGNLMRFCIIPLNTIIFVAAFKIVQMVALFSENHWAANPAWKPHVIWREPGRSLSSSLSSSHRALRTFCYLFPSLRMTQRGLCRGERIRMVILLRTITM